MEWNVGFPINLWPSYYYNYFQLQIIELLLIKHTLKIGKAFY